MSRELARVKEGQRLQGWFVRLVGCISRIAWATGAGVLHDLVFWLSQWSTFFHNFFLQVYDLWYFLDTPAAWWYLFKLVFRGCTTQIPIQHQSLQFNYCIIFNDFGILIYTDIPPKENHYGERKGLVLSGDSWMYPYQRTLRGNPCTSPI